MTSSLTHDMTYICRSISLALKIGRMVGKGRDRVGIVQIGGPFLLLISQQQPERLLSQQQQLLILQLATREVLIDPALLST